MINERIIIDAIIQTLEPRDADIALSAIASELSAAGESEQLESFISALRDRPETYATATECAEQLL